MDDAQRRTAIAVARAGERLNIVTSGDWPYIAVSLLLAGRDEAQLAELAGLPKSASGWDTDPLVADLSDQHGVTVPPRPRPPSSSRGSWRKTCGSDQPR